MSDCDKWPVKQQTTNKIKKSVYIPLKEYRWFFLQKQKTQKEGCSQIFDELRIENSKKK